MHLETLQLRNLLWKQRRLYFLRDRQLVFQPLLFFLIQNQFLNRGRHRIERIRQRRQLIGRLDLNTMTEIRPIDVFGRLVELSHRVSNTTCQPRSNEQRQQFDDREHNRDRQQDVLDTPRDISQCSEQPFIEKRWPCLNPESGGVGLAIGSFCRPVDNRQRRPECDLTIKYVPGCRNRTRSKQGHRFQIVISAISGVRVRADSIPVLSVRRRLGTLLLGRDNSDARHLVQRDLAQIRCDLINQWPVQSLARNDEDLIGPGFHHVCRTQEEFPTVADDFPKAVSDKSGQCQRLRARRTRATRGSVPASPRAYLPSAKVCVVGAHDRKRVHGRPLTFVDLRCQFIRNRTVGNGHSSKMVGDFRRRHEICKLPCQQVKRDERNQRQQDDWNDANENISHNQPVAKSPQQLLPSPAEADDSKQYNREPTEETHPSTYAARYRTT